MFEINSGTRVPHTKEDSQVLYMSRCVAGKKQPKRMVWSLFQRASRPAVEVSHRSVALAGNMVSDANQLFNLRTVLCESWSLPVAAAADAPLQRQMWISAALIIEEQGGQYVMTPESLVKLHLLEMCVCVGESAQQSR